MPTHRRTAMKVRDGRVLKKHNWRLEPGDYRALPQDEIRLDRRRPPDGSRHLITIAELRRVHGPLPAADDVTSVLVLFLLFPTPYASVRSGTRILAFSALHPH